MSVLCCCFFPYLLYFLILLNLCLSIVLVMLCNILSETKRKCTQSSHMENFKVKEVLFLSHTIGNWLYHILLHYQCHQVSSACRVSVELPLSVFESLFSHSMTPDGHSTDIRWHSTLCGIKCLLIWISGVKMSTMVNCLQYWTPFALYTYKW